MFGFGADVAIILVVALLIFGPDKLPEMGRTVGKALNEFKKASAEIEAAVRREMAAVEESESDEDVNALARDASKGARSLKPAGRPGSADSAITSDDDDFDYDDEDE